MANLFIHSINFFPREDVSGVVCATLSAHARELVISHSVCLSPSDFRELTINRSFRYELTQNDNLRPSIVLLFFLIFEKT